MRIHPHDLLLAEFSELLQQGADLSKHLEECSECQERLRSLGITRPKEVTTPTATILHWPDVVLTDAPVAELSVRAQGLENSTGEEILVELIRRPQSKRRSLLQNDWRLQTPEVLRWLIERSLEQASLDPVLGEDLARIAIDLSSILDANISMHPPLNDLQARAWASVGNARRVLFDLTGADEAFQKAFSHLHQGAVEPEGRVLILRLLASLRRDQRRLDDALRLLEHALSLLENTEDSRGTVILLVKISTLHEAEGRPELAIEVLRKALGSLNHEPESSRLLLNLKHNIIVNLVGMGHCAEAAEMFAEIQSLYERFPDAGIQNRRVWVEARIFRGQGDLARAESLFLAAREGFLADANVYDAALVSLDLAALYSKQGRSMDVTRIAVEVFPVFSSQRIDREARAALALLDLPSPTT